MANALKPAALFALLLALAGNIHAQTGRTPTKVGVCPAQPVVYVDDNWVGTALNADPDGAGPANNFGCDSFDTIQGGVNAVATGGLVLVAAGTYNESQVLIERAMTVTGAGAATTIINGGNIPIASAGLVRINLPLLDTGNVTFSDFTVMNPGLTGSSRYHVFGKPISPASTVTIFNLVIPGVNAADYGFYSDRPVGTVVFHHNVLTNNAFNPILIERPTGSTDVHHNTISGQGSTAYFNFTYSANDVTTLQRVADNTINGATGSAISFVGGFQGSTGRYTSVSIVNNTITTLGATRVGIGLSNQAPAGTPAAGAIENPVISGNIITGTNAATSRGIRLNGLVTNASITGNDVRNLARGFTGEVLNTHSATGTQAHFNSFVGNATGFFWDGVAAVNAENNWWGCNAGPGNAGCDSVTGAGAAMVDFNPWLVLGVSAAPNPIAPFGTSNVTADMRHNSDGTDTSASGTVPLTPVAFSATQGTMSPTTGTITAGQAMSTFTSNSGNSGTACATVDNQLVCTAVAVIQQADLAITKTDGVASVGAGGMLTYTIVASNAGPSNAPGSLVTDTFPAGLTCTWTCAGQTGGTCTAAGAGNIADSVNLPLGASVTYTASCVVAAGTANGAVISNTATIAAAAGVTDLAPANNSATDTTTVSALPIITATKSVNPSTGLAGGNPITYTITLSNIGNGVQADNPGDEFTDALPAGITYASSSASSGAVTYSAGTRTVSWNGSIAAGASVVITIEATIDVDANGAIANQGVVHFDADGNGTNEATALTDDPTRPGAADATSFSVTRPIPTLGAFGVPLLMLLLLAFARRRFK